MSLSEPHDPSKLVLRLHLGLVDEHDNLLQGTPVSVHLPPLSTKCLNLTVGLGLNQRLHCSDGVFGSHLPELRDVGVWLLQLQTLDDQILNGVERNGHVIAGSSGDVLHGSPDLTFLILQINECS